MRHFRETMPTMTYSAIFLVLFLLHPFLQSEAVFFGGCDAEVDIVFVLDTSTSILGDENLKKILNFCINIISKFNIDSGDVRVGFVTFSTRHTIEFQLNTYNSKKALIRAIGDIPWRYGSTHTSAGLIAMHSEMFTIANGDRPGIPNVAIVITDGLSNINSKRTVPEADVARSKCIDIFAVGIGLEEKQEVIDIAANRENAFFAKSFDDLGGLDRELSKRACVSTTPAFISTNNTNTTQTLTKTTEDCGNDEFMCFDGECTPMDNFCDNKVDCKDGSDEDTCNIKDEDCNWMNSRMECLHRHDLYGENFKGKMRPMTVYGEMCTSTCGGRQGYGVQCKVNDIFQYCHVPFCNTKATDNRLECNFEASFCGWKITSNATVKNVISEDETGILRISAVEISKTIISSPFLVQSQRARLKLVLSVKRTNSSFWRIEKSGYYQSSTTIPVVHWQNEDCSPCTILTSIYDKLSLVFWTHGYGPHGIEVKLSSISIAGESDQICKWDEFLCDGVCKSMVIVNDGMRDCSFSSLMPDEIALPPCNKNEMLCKSGKCIPDSFPASLKTQCLSNQTEFPFEKTAGSCPSDYICKQNDVFSKSICLRNDYICDGIPHCPHWDDEANCSSRYCPEGCRSCSNNMYVCQPRAIADIPIGAYGIDVSGYDLNVNQFCSKEWSSLSYLNVSRCGISDIPCISNFPFLRLLDLSHNAIAKETFPRHDRAVIILDGNPLQKVTYTSSYRISLRNAGIKTFAWRVRMSKKILTINPDVIKNTYSVLSFCGIRELDLGYNKVESMEFVSRCWNLLYLDVSNNALSSLEKVPLQRLRMIEELNLANNFISLIPSDAFSRTPNLKLLNLGNNNITVIESKAFEKNDHLRTLILGQNNLTDIPSSAFSRLRRLEVLSLERNGITNIDLDTFEDLISLKVLDLSHNNIQHIVKGLFRNMASLEALNLKMNNIATYEDIFYGLRILSSLKVDKFSLCCARPKSVSIENCHSPQISISSCKYLLRIEFLSPFVWFLISIILLGNLVIFIQHYKERKSLSKLSKTFLIHMSVLDFIFGLCIFVIVTADVDSRGMYGFLHERWKVSFICEALRFIFLLSTIASTLFPVSSSLMASIAQQQTWKGKKTFYGIAVWTLSIVITSLCFIVNKLVMSAPSAAHHICLMIPLRNDNASNDSWNMMLTTFHTLSIGMIWFGECWKLRKRKMKLTPFSDIVPLIIFGISIRNAFVCIKDDFCIIREIIPRQTPSEGRVGISKRMIIVIHSSKQVKRTKTNKKQNIQVYFYDETGWEYSCNKIKVVRNVILCDVPPYESIRENSKVMVRVVGLPSENDVESSFWYGRDVTQLTQ